MEGLIDGVINGDITYQKKPLELRYQRTFAVKVSDFTMGLALKLMKGEERRQRVIGSGTTDFH